MVTVRSDTSASKPRDIDTALERRFTRAEYAARAFRLFTRAVEAFKQWRRGRAEERLAIEATRTFIDFVYGAGYPLRLAKRLRPGREK